MLDGTETTATPTADAPTEAAQAQSETRSPISGTNALHLFQEPVGTLRLTVDEGDAWGAYSYASVKLYQAAPLSLPGEYLSLVNGKGDEIYQVRRLSDFPRDEQPLVKEELRRRYLTAVVQAVTGVKTEFGITYWNVITDKGERDFVVQSLSESCVWLSDTHLLLVDVDGNRFEIPDRATLDTESQAHLATVL